jgi:hypothetical protein
LWHRPGHSTHSYANARRDAPRHKNNLAASICSFLQPNFADCGEKLRKFSSALEIRVFSYYIIAAMLKFRFGIAERGRRRFFRGGLTVRGAVPPPPTTGDLFFIKKFGIGMNFNKPLRV